MTNQLIQPSTKRVTWTPDLTYFTFDGMTLERKTISFIFYDLGLRKDPMKEILSERGLAPADYQILYYKFCGDLGDIEPVFLVKPT